MEAPGNGQALRPGGWLPMAQTRPALDLTALFNGFRPLFQGLDPTATNRFAYEIVRTLQGEGGTFDQLLANTSSLTNTIANQDAAVGALIDNLNVVLATVDARSQGLGELIDQLQRLVTGLASNRQTIAAALGNVNLLTVKTASLLQGIRPPLPADLGSLSGLAHTLATTRYPDRRVILAEFLRWMPWKLNTIIRTATYGSFFNFWLCNADVWTPPHNGMGGYSQRSHTNGETEPGHKTAVRPDPACDAP
jgi:phospholipid/cholesterol/gamma-HCH transport system substrate-binding protein